MANAHDASALWAGGCVFVGGSALSAFLFDAGSCHAPEWAAWVIWSNWRPQGSFWGERYRRQKTSVSSWMMFIRI